jgi:hypothetical protein
VDDNKDAADSLAALLEMDGHDVKAVLSHVNYFDRAATTIVAA